MRQIVKVRIITTAVTVTAALASGLFMNFTHSWGTRPQIAEPEEVITPLITREDLEAANTVDVTNTANLGPVAPTLSQMTSAYENVTRGALQPSASMPQMPSFPLAPEAEPMTLQKNELPIGADTSADHACDFTLTAVPSQGGTADLVLNAPCYGGMDVEVLHSGLRFSATLDTDGMARFRIPTLSENARFRVDFPDGQTDDVNVISTQALDFDRVAMTWQGDQGFELHALENNATYGTPGHVSAENSYDPARAERGEGGYYTGLGQNVAGFHAAIYSWPIRLGESGPAPIITVEVLVSEANCGADISGTLIVVDAGSAPQASDIEVRVPGCEAVGEYLLLKSISRNRNIAAE